MNPLIMSCNKHKDCIVNDAVAGKIDLAAFTVAIRGNRYSCPTSMEFGDVDIIFHGKRISAVAANRDADRSHLMEKVGNLAVKIRSTYGAGLNLLRTERDKTYDLATSHGNIIRRIDDMISVMKAELALREVDREAHKECVAAERASKTAAAAAQAAQVTVITLVKTPEFKFTKRPAHKTFQCRGEITLQGFEALKEYQENTALLS